uniref:Pre-mRNA-splicing factor cwf14 n=1 Tax=Talaromyces marneffei PM1 TaxID=1077442 RepID=A0A093VAC5_TALMA
MPPIRTTRNAKPPPAGFDDIEDTLLEFSNKMKDAENAPHEGKKRHEVLWPVFQISHQRSRYIYELYYEKEAISKQLYDWLLKNKYADAMLIAKWKKQVMLPPMHTDERDQFQLYVYLSSAQSSAKGGAGDTVR